MNGLLFLLSISGWRQSCKLELSKSSLHAAPRQPFFCVRFLLPMATPSLVHARSNSRSELQQCPLRAGSPPTSCLSPCQVNQPTAARVFSKPHSPLAGGGFGVGVGRGLADMGKAASGWPPGTVQMEGRVWRNGGGGTEKKLQEDLPWAWGCFGGTWGGGLGEVLSFATQIRGVVSGGEAMCSCRWGVDRLRPCVCRVGSSRGLLPGKHGRFGNGAAGNACRHSQNLHPRPSTPPVGTPVQPHGLLQCFIRPGDAISRC